MSTMPAATKRGALSASSFGPSFGSRWKRSPSWGYGSTGASREAALNWLAFGLLLAAWNVSNDDPSNSVQSRPDSLRGYPFVSARAASLHAPQLGAAPMN